MNCKFYKNWNESNPQYMKVIELKRRLLDIKSPEERIKFRKKNEHVCYIFCDGQWHFKSKCEDFMYKISSYRCPMYREYQGQQK